VVYVCQIRQYTGICSAKNTDCTHIIFPRSVLQLLVTANVVPSSPILVTLMMEEIRSSCTSLLTPTKRRNILKDGILHTNRIGNLKSYIAWLDSVAEM
jgi:hypothetical protein